MKSKIIQSKLGVLVYYLQAPLIVIPFSLLFGREIFRDMLYIAFLTPVGAYINYQTMRILINEENLETFNARHNYIFKYDEITEIKVTPSISNLLTPSKVIKFKSNITTKKFNNFVVSNEDYLELKNLIQVRNNK